MTNERYIRIDVDAEVESYFNASSDSQGTAPDFVIVVGGPAVGKTTLRKQPHPCLKRNLYANQGSYDVAACPGQNLDR